MTRALAGIFVGGAGQRMGGIAKGLLRAPQGGTLIEQWLALLLPRAIDVVLVGARPEYAGLGLEVLVDRPSGIGPLGGLVALLERAEARPALAFACDMPFVPGSLVDRLLTFLLEAPIVAPRRDGRWEPLCARYDSARVLEAAKAQAAGEGHSLQQLLTEAGAVELPIDGNEDDLHDWDEPRDLE